MATFIVNRSVNQSLTVGQRIKSAEDGSVELDLGYGLVKVNPKYIVFLMEVKEPKKGLDFSSIAADRGNSAGIDLTVQPAPKLISGMTEEDFDARFLHSLGVYAGSQAKFDPAPLTDAQKTLLQKVIEDDVRLNGGRNGKA